MRLRDRAFLGTGWAFPPRFGTDGSVAMQSGVSDIEEALLILLHTNLGERTMRPRFGVDAQVFAGVDGAEAAELQSRVEAAVIEHEPRVKVLDIVVDQSGRLDGCILIRIDYVVPSVNARHNLVFPYYLREGSLIEASNPLVPDDSGQ